MSETQGVRYNILAQYVKNNYIEVPRGIVKNNTTLNTTLDIAVNIILVKNLLYEVTLTTGYNCTFQPEQSEEDSVSTRTREDIICFIGKVSYAFFIEVIQEENEELNSEEINYCLNVDIPSLIFPFSRHLISFMTSSCGYQPLNLTLINFKEYYLSRLTNKEDSDQD